MRGYMSFVVVAMVAIVLTVTGCGQKAETIKFADANEKGMLDFKYTITTGGARGERDTEFARTVATDNIPMSLGFTPAEKHRVVIDRHTEGTVVRIEIEHAGHNRCCECVVNADRVYTGSFMVRGRRAYSVTQAELLRHVAPTMVEMLRADEPAK